MAVDFGAGGNNNDTYYTLANGVGGLALPDSDWAVLMWVDLARGLNTGEAYQYFLSCGTLGGANSFNLFFGDGSSNKNELVLRMRGAAGTEINWTAILAATPGAPDYNTATHHLLVIQRRGTDVECYWVPQDGTVAAPLRTTGLRGNTTVTPPTTWFVGCRADVQSARCYQNALSELVFITDSSLTAAQVTALAAAVPVTDVYSAPAAYLRFLEASASVADLKGDHTATLSGSNAGTKAGPVPAGGAAAIDTLFFGGSF